MADTGARESGLAAVAIRSEMQRVGDYGNAMEILQSVNHAVPAQEVPAQTTAHKVSRGPHEIMGVDKSPRTAATAGGATQEVEAPMHPKSATRFTVFAVSRECRTYASTDGIPWGHRPTEAEAKQLVREIDADRRAHPTRIVERDSAYPFTKRRVVWRCDA